MSKIKLLLLVLVLFIFQSQIFAQTSNYTGTWILNLKKSKIVSGADGMTGSVFVIKQVADSFSLTIHHIFGDKRDTILIQMLSDGKTRQVLNIFQGKLEQKLNYLEVTLWKKDFLDKVNYKFGDNKNEFIADEVLTSDSDNHHNIWVFDREILK